MLVNMTGVTQTLPAGTVISTVSECEKVQASVNKIQGGSEVRVNKVMTQEMVDDRRAKLRTLMNETGNTLSSSEMEILYKLLSEHHEARERKR